MKGTLFARLCWWGCSCSAFLYSSLANASLRRILLSNPAFLFLMGWSILSVLWSNFPDFAIRRLLGTVVAACLTLVVTSLSPRRLIAVLLIVIGTVMVVDYAGLLFVPERALDHEGLWKGLHSHKNVAGEFSIIAALIWLFVGYARRSVWLITGGIAWAVYSWFTGSKTSFGMFLAVLLIGLMFSWGLNRGFDRRVLILVPLFGVVGILLIVIGTIAFEALFGDLDLTFTGRTEIWAFVWDSALKAPLIGVGYGSFWAVGDSSAALLLANDNVAQYTEAHNGYLDVLVQLGFVGLLLTLATLAEAYRKLFNYSIATTDAATREAVLCALVLLTFGLLHNSLESTLLQGVSILWTLMLLSIWLITSTISTNRESKHARANTWEAEARGPHADIQCRGQDPSDT